MSYRNEIGKAYLMTYYKVIHNQFSAIFNHAIWYYELSSNPVSKAGNMGKEKTEDMLFLIKDEYNAFDFERDNIRITKIYQRIHGGVGRRSGNAGHPAR